MADGGVLAAVGAVQQAVEQGQGPHPVVGADGVGQFVKRPLLGTQHHGLHVAQRDAPPQPSGGRAVRGGPASSQSVKQQFFQLRGDEHHVGAQRIDKFAGRVGIDSGAGLLRRGRHPAHRVFLVHAGQFHHAAMLAQRLGQALEAVLVVHLHPPRIGGDAQEIGDKNQERLRIRRVEVAAQSRELLLLGAAGVELTHVAHKNHLERRHQRRSPRPVQHFEDRGPGEIQVGEAEVPEIGRHKGLEHGAAAAVQQKGFVAGQHIAGLERPLAGRGSLDLRHKACHGGKSRAPARAAHRTGLRIARPLDAYIMRLQNTFPGTAKPAFQEKSDQNPHGRLPQRLKTAAGGRPQNPSNTSATNCRANSRERRSTATGFSCKNVGRFVVDWYCWRKR